MAPPGRCCLRYGPGNVWNLFLVGTPNELSFGYIPPEAWVSGRSHDEPSLRAVTVARVTATGAFAGSTTRKVPTSCPSRNTVPSPPAGERARERGFMDGHYLLWLSNSVILLRRSIGYVWFAYEDA